MSNSGGDGGSDNSGQADWMRSGLNAEAPGSVGDAPGRGKTLFATFPGVVTAAATVVVALGVGLVITTVYGGSDGPGVRRDRRRPRPPRRRSPPERLRPASFRGRSTLGECRRRWPRYPGTTTSSP